MADDGDNVIPINPKTGKPKRTMTPEAKAKWLQSVKRTNNKPASGIPAMGGIVGGEYLPPGLDNALAQRRKLAALPLEDKEARRRLLLERSDNYHDLMDEIITDPETPVPVKVVAINQQQDRILGKAPIINVNMDEGGAERLGIQVEFIPARKDGG